MKLVARVKAAGRGLVDRAKRTLARVRERWPALDHIIRAYGRYDTQRGNQLAGSVTFFGFLSFFPLLALAFAVAGYAAAVYPEARDTLQEAITSMLPGLTGRGGFDVRGLAAAKEGLGLFGLVGLLVAGLGWVDALREALRRVWLLDPAAGGNIVVKKLWDVAVLVVLGLCLLASVAVSSLATSATELVLAAVGIGGSPVAGWVLTVLAVCVPLVFDTVIFLVMFSRLSGSAQRWVTLFRGAVLGAVGFEVLKLVGTAYIPTVADDPIYGTFGLIVALLVWINLVARFSLYAACWTATIRAFVAEEPAVGADVEQG